ncbi:MAG: exo-alpha-sialidase [Acidimicrobiia bacterium]|nr:exo-alpha-sialidase [Acidimicrobiia bacterium]
MRIISTKTGPLRVVERGVVRAAEPGTAHAVFTYPTLTPLSNGRILATFRAGSSKDGDDENSELFESPDGGRTWEQIPFQGPRIVNGVRGTSRLCHITEIEPGHLLAAVMWVDRQSFPDKPLFNPQTEGCLPMVILLADSHDYGRTWSPWRVIPMPEEIGPASLTDAIMKLKDGTLAMSIETNKAYDDSSKWYQRVVLFHSKDQGQTWGPPVVAGFDRTGRIYNWDQRTGVTPDGRIVAFLWTYDSTAHSYLNMRRRISADNGYTWTEAEDLGFADQAGHPAILSDGRVVEAYVDRFGTQSIRARWAPDAAGPFPAETAVVIYAHETTGSKGPHTGTTSATISDMLVAWTYGLPFAEALPDGDVLVVYYAGTNRAMDACWARLRLP